MKKKSKKILTISLISLLVLGILGVFYFVTSQNISPTGFDFISVSKITETQEIISLSLESFAYGQPATYSNFKSQIAEFIVKGNPNRQPSGFPTIKNPDEISDISSPTNQVIYNYQIKQAVNNLWTYADYTSQGNATCKAIIEGGKIYDFSVRPFKLLTDKYINMICEVKINLNVPQCDSGESCTFLVKSIKISANIQKVGFEKIQFYTFSNNQCNQRIIYLKDKLSNDYLTLSECKNNILEEFKENQTDISNPPIIPSEPNDVLENPENYMPLIILVSIVLLIIMFLFLKKKRGKK